MRCLEARLYEPRPPPARRDKNDDNDDDDDDDDGGGDGDENDANDDNGGNHPRETWSLGGFSSVASSSHLGAEGASDPPRWLLLRLPEALRRQS
ncbi:hypothetical protein KM043_013730 [Ampulex compressa]|nr:hypothetical protein KM043_013730 [Ampulex compressa]